MEYGELVHHRKEWRIIISLATDFDLVEGKNTEADEIFV